MANEQQFIYLKCLDVHSLQLVKVKLRNINLTLLECVHVC